MGLVLLGVLGRVGRCFGSVERAGADDVVVAVDGKDEGGGVEMVERRDLGERIERDGVLDDLGDVRELGTGRTVALGSVDIGIGEADSMRMWEYDTRTQKKKKTKRKNVIDDLFSGLS